MRFLSWEFWLKFLAIWRIERILKENRIEIDLFQNFATKILWNIFRTWIMGFLKASLTFSFQVCHFESRSVGNTLKWEKWWRNFNIFKKLTSNKIFYWKKIREQKYLKWLEWSEKLIKSALFRRIFNANFVSDRFFFWIRITQAWSILDMGGINLDRWICTRREKKSRF